MVHAGCPLIRQWMKVDSSCRTDWVFVGIGCPAMENEILTRALHGFASGWFGVQSSWDAGPGAHGHLIRPCGHWAVAGIVECSCFIIHALGFRQIACFHNLLLLTYKFSDAVK